MYAEQMELYNYIVNSEKFSNRYKYAHKSNIIAMRKLTICGELCPDHCDYGIEWCGDVELEDEQASNL